MRTAHIQPNTRPAQRKAEETRAQNVLWLHVRELRFNPANMYEIKPTAESHEMADSIRERGVLQPLRVMAARDYGYVVKDGNLRLQALNQIGDMGALVPCLLVDESEIESEFNSVAANLVRRRGDPVAEARYFKQMMDAHGLSIQSLAKRIGINPAKISGVMHLLKVDPEIQELVASHKLVRDARVHRALASIPDRQARIGLAGKLAESGASITECVDAVSTYLTIAARRGQRRGQERTARKVDALGNTPALTIQGGAFPDDRTALPLPDLRASAAAMCKACDLGAHAGQFAHEPSWALVMHAAHKTCADCNLPKLREVCAACPGVALIADIARRTGGRA